MTPRFRFRVDYRQFKTGDPVPDAFDEGIRATLIGRGIVEAVPEPVTVPPDEDDAPTGFRPALDKAVRTGSTRVKRKEMQR